MATETGTEASTPDYAQGEAAAIARDLSTQEWVPFIDWSQTHPGNRGVNRQGRYELYDAPVGVRIRVEQAAKSDPVLTSNDRWEGGGNMVPLRVWRDGGTYKMLYAAYQHRSDDKSPGLGGGHHLCYAQSADGYHWQRPELGQVEWQGSRANNIIANPPTGTPFEDPRGTPEERFKAIGQVGASFDPDTGEKLDTVEAYNRWRRQEYEGDAYTGPRAESRHWVEGWTSPDGVRWTSVGRVGDMSSDGGSAAQYDEETGGYYAYIRVGGMGRRATGLTRTDDFWQWPPASLVLAPDPQDDPDLSFYGCSYFRYPGNPDLHCAFVETYHQVGDYNDAQIAFSRDMTHWFRPDRRSIIPCGEPGNPDSGGARPWGGLIELPDGYWATMYRGHVGLHNYRASEPEIPHRPGVLQLARWLPHRFCGVEAEMEGRFTIPTVQRGRDTLRLNYRCRPGGHIQVELIRTVPSRIHPDADPIPGYSFADCDLLSGDYLDRPVSWRGSTDLSAAGDQIAVRLRMFQAKVFAYSA